MIRRITSLLLPLIALAALPLQGADSALGSQPASVEAEAAPTDDSTNSWEQRLALSAEALVNAGRGEFAPYYIASNRHGVLTQGSGALLRANAIVAPDMHKRFTWAAGLSVIAGVASGVDYLRYSGGAWVVNPQRPSSFRLQQCYFEAKWRQFSASVGLKERGSLLLNDRLSSGDLTESGNARPIPQMRIGFVDFQNIPFTRGALQINCALAFGLFADDGWLRNHYNYFNYHITRHELYVYRRCHFRTDPRQPFSAIFGMQAGGEFGGSVDIYRHGEFRKSQHMSQSLNAFFKMLLPLENGSDYYIGSSLGSWDVVLRYRLRSGHVIKAYLEKPWEDGSGIGMLNGFDGLWGLEWRLPDPDLPVTAVVVEYLDFTNQSGPMHWDYQDEVGSDIYYHADGADDYYNNHQSRAYANYGMSIGSPFLRSPIYNLNGSLQFLNNRCRGFHAALEGRISPTLTYRLLGSYRKSWGSGRIPLYRPITDTSLMVEASFTTPVRGLTVVAQLGLDFGKLYGDNTGACVSLSYTGFNNLIHSRKR